MSTELKTTFSPVQSSLVQSIPVKVHKFILKINREIFPNDKGVFQMEQITIRKINCIPGIF